ncbi:hypothetical protein K435DRAFT_970560 [Dendrothele bispora CBS 962.96]|uniref:SAP domain-containing protein n=1 Tax=Dendrothele bispora (strain CBS 962.96) TaxID=1314807 RepID=A0A4S8LB13_DENBC|nr:hypothetical protein K435DRAFT_970560 [Dendrothele bispora CBS 962.96]
MADLDPAFIQAQAQDPRDQPFTFPDKSGNGTFESPIYSLNKSELKALCGDLGLKISGNMSILRTRLKDYSEQPSEWNKNGPIVRRKHKGVRKVKDEGSGSKKKSLLEERIAELRPDTAGAPRLIERSKDMRTERQKEDHLPWAERVCAMFPDYQTPRNMTKNVAGSGPAGIEDDKINAKLDAIQIQLDSIAKISMVTGPVLGSTTAPALPIDPMTSTGSWISSDPGQTPSFPPPHQLSTVPIIPITPITSTTSSSPSPSTERKSRHLTLKTGVVIHYNKEDLPDPPYLSFHDNIPRLGRLWDESHPEFSQEPCHVQVNGVGVPLRLWDQLYTYTGTKTWKGIKGSWSNWKFVAEYYNETTPEKFWEEFYDKRGKKPMTWTAIVDKLREQRKAKDVSEVAAVKETLGVDFASEYHVRGKPLTRPSAIAKRSRFKANQIA